MAAIAAQKRGRKPLSAVLLAEALRGFAASRKQSPQGEVLGEKARAELLFLGRAVRFSNDDCLESWLAHAAIRLFHWLGMLDLLVSWRLIAAWLTRPIDKMIALLSAQLGAPRRR